MTIIQYLLYILLYKWLVGQQEKCNRYMQGSSLSKKLLLLLLLFVFISTLLLKCNARYVFLTILITVYTRNIIVTISLSTISLSVTSRSNQLFRDRSRHHVCFFCRCGVFFSNKGLLCVSFCTSFLYDLTNKSHAEFF